MENIISANDTPETAQRADAARANGALSRGPITPEGKANSSRNALRHGIRARNLSFSNEDAEILNSMIEGYTAEYRPETPSERDLVVEMAYNKWRIRRMWLAEIAEINKEMALTRDAVNATFGNYEESVRTVVAVASSLNRTRPLNTPLVLQKPRAGESENKIKMHKRTQQVKANTVLTKFDNTGDTPKPANSNHTGNPTTEEGAK